MPAFKEDQIMILAPGSLITLAQLGLPESFTPAQLRIPSRMFPGEKAGEWEPYKIRSRQRPQLPVTSDADPATTNGTDEPELYEDYESDEGAVYPMVNGRITNWSCFFALLSYVYNKLSPHMHIQTPILLVAQPCWSEKDHEAISGFVFEKFRCPAFSLMDSASAALYGFNVENACVIDVGFGKADITAIAGFEVERIGRKIALPKLGGEAMTQNLLKNLESKGMTRDMCEQLKKNPICEILPIGTPLPGAGSATGESITNPAAAASTGATGSGPGHRNPNEAPRGPGPNTEVGEEGKTTNPDEEGVLDVASLVTAGADKMQEMLAKKEKEKADKAARRKAGAADKNKEPVKLLNSQKYKATFAYDDRTSSRASASITQSAASDGVEAPVSTDAAQAGGSSRREVEVGTERFLAASDGYLDNLSQAIYEAINHVEVAKRADVWDQLILVGNGSKVKGFRDALLTHIQKKYIISPSSATIFTSEIPSNISTPMGTGAQTPQPLPQNPMGLPMQGQGGGVNPLLLAATTASNPQLQQLQQQQLGMPPQQHNLHSSHGQTPANAKYAKPMEYFPDWKEHGFEEAHFLGAQVAAKLFFIGPPGDFKTYMLRSDYNELGPSGVHSIYV